MKLINQAFVFVIVMLNSFVFCVVSRGEEYKATDLPFKAVDLVIDKGGGYSEKVEKDGEELKIKPMCSGMSLKALYLGEREIPLQSTNITSDAMIVTKDYGNLRIKINMATYSYSILVTQKQEELFRKLASKRESVPADATRLSKIGRADVVSTEPSGEGTLVTVRVPIGRPLAPEGPFYLTPQSPFVVAQDGSVHFWDGWMNDTPTSKDPVLWRPLTPRSVELEFLRSASAKPGEGTFNIRCIKDTKVAGAKVESNRKVRFTEEGAAEITLFYRVPSNTISIVGIIVWDVSCPPATREAGLNEEDLKGWAKADEPKVPFGITTNQVLGMMPFGNRTYLASAKQGHHFLIVATTEMKKDQKISSTQMKQVVLDEKKTEFTPIAFGMPHVWGEPFMILGYSFEGDIATTDANVDTTLLVLYYLVPTTSEKFILRNVKGEAVPVRILTRWDAPKQMRILGFKAYGKVNFGTPTVKENGWGLKSSD